MPAAVDVADVIDALYLHLTEDGDFNTSIGGTAAAAGRIVYGQVDEREKALPFAVLNVITTTPFDSMQNDGYETLVQLSIYSDAESSTPRANGVIADQARALLHRESFTVQGHQAMASATVQTRGPLREGNAWRTDIDFNLHGRRD